MPVSTQISAVPPKSLESMMMPKKEPEMQAMKPKLERFLYTKNCNDFTMSTDIF